MGRIFDRREKADAYRKRLFDADVATDLQRRGYGNEPLALNIRSIRAPDILYLGSVKEMTMTEPRDTLRH